MAANTVPNPDASSSPERSAEAVHGKMDDIKAQGGGISWRSLIATFSASCW